MTVVLDPVINRNYRYFRITLQWLQISQSIIYAHHYLEIMVIIIPAMTSFYNYIDNIHTLHCHKFFFLTFDNYISV